MIPTRNRREELRETLGTLWRQTLPADTYEVVVSVDGSDDGTVEMLAALETPCRPVPLAQPHRGRAAAVNAGLRVASGHVLVILDDDIRAAPHLLEAHRDFLARYPGHAVVGAAPIAVPPDAPAVVRHVGTKMNAHLERIGRPGFQFGERDFYSGNFAIERALLAKVGGFDEDFTLYGNEDCELAHRLVLAGIPIVYNGAAEGYQRYTKAFPDLARDTYQKGRTRVLFSRKHPEATSRLEISAPPRLSWKLRLLMTVLLRAAPQTSRALDVILRLIKWLDRRWPGFTVPRYTAILDFCFWLGVNEELRARRQTP